jgi:hypothetical protein
MNYKASARLSAKRCGNAGGSPKWTGGLKKVSPRKRGREYVTGRQISKVGAHTAAAPVFFKARLSADSDGVRTFSSKVQSWLIVLRFRDALKAELRRAFRAGVGSLRDDEPLLIDDPAYDFF